MENSKLAVTEYTVDYDTVRMISLEIKGKERLRRSWPIDNVYSLEDGTLVEEGYGERFAQALKDIVKAINNDV